MAFLRDRSDDDSMSTLIIDSWQSNEPTAAEHIVMPDGCRDIIYRKRPGCPPEWFVSPLFDTAKVIKSTGMTTMIGFRLKAGVKLNAPKLLNALQTQSPEKSTVANALASETEQYSLAEEAMNMLALGPPDIKTAARTLGVSTRTLQRRVLETTERTPAYWLNLRRARKCVQSIDPHQSLSEIADQCGYSDQSHMNRELRRWFNTTPGEFQRSPDLKSLIAMPGYGDV